MDGRGRAGPRPAAITLTAWCWACSGRRGSETLRAIPATNAGWLRPARYGAHGTLLRRRWSRVAHRCRQRSNRRGCQNWECGTAPAPSVRDKLVQLTAPGPSNAMVLRAADHPINAGWRGRLLGRPAAGRCADPTGGRWREVPTRTTGNCWKASGPRSDPVRRLPGINLMPPPRRSTPTAGTAPATSRWSTAVGCTASWTRVGRDLTVADTGRAPVNWNGAAFGIRRREVAAGLSGCPDDDLGQRTLPTVGSAKCRCGRAYQLCCPTTFGAQSARARCVS